MTNLVLGRTMADVEIASAVHAAQGNKGQRDRGLQDATGRAAKVVSEDSCAAIGLGKDPDRLLGADAVVLGSLAGIAAGFTEHGGAMTLRTGAMFADVHPQINADAPSGTFGYALRTRYTLRGRLENG